MAGPHIEIVNGLDRRIVTVAIRHALQTLFLNEKKLNVALELLVTDDAEMQRLNRQMRGEDQATDVLTFPAPPTSDLLGNIALSIDAATTQAKRRGVRVQDEMAMLAVHGALHLLGWDDQTEPERRAMVVKMNEIMALAGLPTDDEWESLPHPGEE